MFLKLVSYLKSFLYSFKDHLIIYVTLTNQIGKYEKKIGRYLWQIVVYLLYFYRIYASISSDESERKDFDDYLKYIKPFKEALFNR